MELERLFKSLINSTVSPVAAVVNDDSADLATEGVVKGLGFPAELLVRQPCPENSAASGWNRGLDAAVAKFGNLATHYLIIDDDAKVEVDTLELLLDVLRQTDAKSAFPAAFDPKGEFYVTGQLVDRRHEAAQKRCRSREELLREFRGENPRAWMFQGLCHLMHRDVVHSGVRFDERFWMCGEDLDFSVRVADGWGSVFVPQATCWHLYGAPFNPKSARNSHYLKMLSFLQNMTYAGYWRSYGPRIRGRHFDFLRGRGLARKWGMVFREFPVNRHTMYDLLWVIFFGMVLGQPSNGWGGRKLRERRRNFFVE
jgi:GT2 family glycosyltransferase